MRNIPCELTLGNGGDIVAMARLDDDGTLHIPRFATYATFTEGVLSCKVMLESDRQQVLREVWEEAEATP